LVLSECAAKHFRSFRNIRVEVYEDEYVKIGIPPGWVPTSADYPWLGGSIQAADAALVLRKND
jgi:hypothetical protein